MRREAQLIVPNLYLGPFQTATKLAKMQDLGLTHVCVLFFHAHEFESSTTDAVFRLCVRDRREKSLIFPRFPDHFVYYVLEISDDPVGPSVTPVFWLVIC